MATSFAHAPVSKGAIITLVTASLLFSGRGHLLDVPFIPHLSRDHQFWRLAVHHLAFSTSAELFLAMVLLWQVSVNVERVYGSLRFASFLLSSALLSSVIELCLLIIGARSFGSPRVIPAGPHALLFALLYQAHRLIPPLYTYRIFGFTFPSQTPSYVLALQMFLLSPLTCSVGLVVGAAYRAAWLPLGKWRIPRPIARALGRLLGPVVVSSGSFGTTGRRPTHTTWADDPRYVPVPTSSATDAATTTARARTSLSNTAAGLRRLGNPAPGNAVPAVTATQVADLQAMFPQRSAEEVRNALTQANGNVERAVEQLLLR